MLAGLWVDGMVELMVEKKEKRWAGHLVAKLAQMKAVYWVESMVDK